MKRILRKINLSIDQNNLQDAVFLLGIFIFFAVIVIGLFPDKNSDLFIGKDFFIYAVMTVPIIAAIYFIIISFRRNLYLDSFSIGGSFRNKMVLAFVFVAILSSLPIIFASNNFMNEILTRLASDKTSRALDLAIKMSDDSILQIRDEIKTEADVIRFLINTGKVKILYKSEREKVRSLSGLRGIGVEFFKYDIGIEKRKITPLDKMISSRKLLLFYQGIVFKEKTRVDRLRLPGEDILAGAMLMNRHLIVLYKKIPPHIETRSVLLSNSVEDFLRLRYLREYFRDWGYFLTVYFNYCYFYCHIDQHISFKKYHTPGS